MSHPDPRHDSDNVYPSDNYLPTRNKMAKKMKTPRASQTVKSWSKEIKHAGDLPKRKKVKWNV